MRLYLKVNTEKGIGAVASGLRALSATEVLNLPNAAAISTISHVMVTPNHKFISVAAS